MHQELVAAKDSIAQSGTDEAGKHDSSLVDVLAGELFLSFARLDDWNNQMRILLG